MRRSWWILQKAAAYVPHVVEVANLQLEELTAYDRGLDRVLDKAYDDVESTARPHAIRQRHRVLADLRETRIDLMARGRRTIQHHEVYRRLAPGAGLHGLRNSFRSPQWGDMVNLEAPFAGRPVHHVAARQHQSTDAAAGDCRRSRPSSSMWW